MPIAEAKALGAMALFGEKYPDVVRVVEMGDFSRELCGGTHLDNVGQVGLFKLIGEESVSAGTRRITALTGKAALDLIRQEEETLTEVASALKVPVPMVAERVTALLEEIKALKETGERDENAPSVIRKIHKKSVEPDPPRGLFATTFSGKQLVAQKRQEIAKAIERQNVEWRAAGKGILQIKAYEIVSDDWSGFVTETKILRRRKVEERYPDLLQQLDRKASRV